jgi:hypothetical protein
MRCIGIAFACAALLSIGDAVVAAEPVPPTQKVPAARRAETGPAVPSTTDTVLFSRFLALVQGVMQAAASAPPGQENRAADRAVRDVLAGRNADANALARDIFVALPPEDQMRLLAIARSASELAERNAVTAQREAAVAQAATSEREAIDARKDLAAMGLVYHDRSQFLDAVTRSDAIAVGLFVRARGVDLRARDASGATALDLARRGGSAEIVSLLARAMQ